MTINKNKAILFTDIHHGRKGNSDIHNTDTSDFIDWMITKIKSDTSISTIIFLGDWFETRSAINISTLDFSHSNLEKLNDVGLPIYFCVGNHDLYRRHNRDVFSVKIFNTFKNIHIISEITTLNICGASVLLSPYLFKHEYEILKERQKDVDYMFGHFEFKDFILTGGSYKLEHGPDGNEFSHPKRIFSGHFHKRQSQKNIHFIGNTFPMDMGDCGDTLRGCATIDLVTNQLEFFDWKEAPKYYKYKLSDLLSSDILSTTDFSKSYVEIHVDIELAYSDSIDIKNVILASGARSVQLRNTFTLETTDEENILEESVVNTETTSDTIIKFLASIKDLKNIKTTKLIDLYKTL